MRRVDEERPAGVDSRHDPVRRRRAPPAGSEVARSIAGQFLLREEAGSGNRSAQLRDDPAEDGNAVRVRSEAGGVESARDAHIDPRAYGQPIEPRAVPASLDQDTGKLSLGDV